VIVACFVSSAGYGDEAIASSQFWTRKPSADFQLRVLCWNVKVNSVFPPDGQRRDSFRRIVKAVEPDVICLQEIFDPHKDKAAELAGLVDRYLPLPQGQSWHILSASDNAIFSRFPLRHTRRELAVPFALPKFRDYHFGHAMCLVDVPDDLCQRDFYFVAMHNKSRGGEENVRLRQRHSDAIVSVLRELRLSQGENRIADRTPILIVGDLNVLAVEPADPAHHLTTLLTGNIWDESVFGADFPLDWDGSPVVEAKPRHNARAKEFYTWREDDTPFPPGALDRILYTDSVLVLNHSFVLNTTEMTADELTASGLLNSDVLLGGAVGNYDHLPMVADFSVRQVSDAAAGDPR
jgi:endonuclease/exonuclease/phosphatase family metal-dependent hydrolase